MKGTCKYPRGRCLSEHTLAYSETARDNCQQRLANGRVHLMGCDRIYIEFNVNRLPEVIF